MTGLYADPFVRRRLTEFLGGERLERATSTYVTHTDGCQFSRRELHAPDELEWFLERDLDIARSLADSESHLLHLDLEYVNFDSPGESFLNPQRCFQLQEPVVKVIEVLLLGWGIHPLHIITGQGHHFVWRIDKSSPVAREVLDLGLGPELIERCLERLPSPLVGRISGVDQGFFAAVALLIEYAAHRIKEEAASCCELPVEITAVHVGPCLTLQREMISIDLSEYGDPLHTRMIRMPFTHYRKPWVSGLVGWLGIADRLHPFETVPLHEMDVSQAIRLREVEQEVLELARRACVRIPLQEAGTRHLLENYRSSRLRQLHEYYYATGHGTWDEWAAWYGPAELDELPPCARHVLAFPNDLLLKPAGMQLVTRCLLARHWHPRHIAGLIRSKFEDPTHGWGVDWNDYDAATRADFYTRVFACLHLAGVDRLLDFNCTSTQEKGFCFQPPDVACNLEPSRQILLDPSLHD